jgi:integrase
MGVRIRERDGAWWVFVNHKGRRRAKRVGSKDAAKELKTRLEKRLAAGDLRLLEKPGVTFVKASETWLKGYVEPTLKPTTYDAYALVTRRFLLPAFGARSLRDLTRPAIREALAGWHAKKLSPKYVHVITAALSGILQQAVEDGHLDHNPAASLGRYAARTEDPELTQERVKFWTGEQLGRILARTQQDYPEWHDLFATLAWAGLRVGEGLGLKWEDLDRERSVVSVRRTVDDEGRITAPKGNRGRRVEMGSRLAALLADRESRLQAEAAVAGRAPSPWVFPPTRGQRKDGPARYESAVKVLAHVLDLEKIPRYERVMTHAFRHSWATLTLQRAQTPAAILYVSRQLGHASVTITLDVYGHLIPEENRHLSELAAGAMQPNATPAQLASGQPSEVLEIPAASPRIK